MQTSRQTFNQIIAHKAFLHEQQKRTSMQAIATCYQGQSLGNIKSIDPATPAIINAQDVANAILPMLKTQIVQEILQQFQDVPGIRSGGLVSQDGGTSDQNTKSFAD